MTFVSKDFAEEKIYEAKMAPHKQELLDMYAGWKAGKLTVNQVLVRVPFVICCCFICYNIGKFGKGSK